MEREDPFGEPQILDTSIGILTGKVQQPGILEVRPLYGEFEFMRKDGSVDTADTFLPALSAKGQNLLINKDGLR